MMHIHTFLLAPEIDIFPLSIYKSGENDPPYTVLFNGTQLFVSLKNLQHSFSLQNLKQTQIHL